MSIYISKNKLTLCANEIILKSAPDLQCFFLTGNLNHFGHFEKD